MSTSPSPDGRRALGVIAGGLFLTMIPVTLLVVPLKELIGDRYAVSAFWTHAFQSTNLLGAIVFAPIVGAWSDRLGSRRGVIGTALLLDAALFAAMWSTESFPLLMVFRFFEGAAHIAAVSTWMALAADGSTPERRGRTMGAVGAALTFGVAVGAPLGAVFARQNASETVMLAAAALSAIAGSFALAAIRSPALGPNRSVPRAAGLHVLRETPALLIPFAYAFIDRLCVGVIISSFTLYTAAVLELSLALRGGLMAALLIPYASLAYPLGRWSDRFGRAKPMIIGSLGYGVVFASIGWLPVGPLFAAFIVLGVLSAFMAIPTLTISGDLAADGRRAAVFGTFNAVGSFGFFLGPLVGGALVEFGARSGDLVGGYRAAFAVAGGLEVLIALATLPWLIRLVHSGKTR